MTITIRNLVDSPDLGTRLFAGSTGLDNQISWAHACELTDPAEWLAPGELLLTVGYSVPEQPTAQKAYIKHLAQAGISGIVIGENLFAPELSDELKLAADQWSFPVLLNAYDVPYTSIVRAVADANRTVEHARLLKIIRIYEQARNALGRVAEAKLITELGIIIDAECFVVDPANGRRVFPDGQSLPADLFRALQKQVQQRTMPIPALLRLDDNEGTTIAIRVPAPYQPVLVVRCATQNKMPHTSLLHHVAAVAAMEVEKLTAEYDRKRVLGSEVLAGLIDGRLATDLAEPMLSERGLSAEPRRLATVTGDLIENEHSDLHLKLEFRAVPNLVLRRTPILTALLSDTAESINAFREVIGSGFSIGFSATIGTLSRIPEAYREARWALDAAMASNREVVEYGKAPAWSPFLPNTLNDANRVVEHILGPIIKHDAANNAQLIKSLDAFLSNQRSWQRTASKLHIHHQTLRYRMRTVENLTGRKLNETQDVAELWFALLTAKTGSSQ